MAIEFKFDISKFRKQLGVTDKMIAAGAKRGLHDVLDEWQFKSRNLAPLDKGTVRRNIDINIEGNNFELSGQITANAIESSSNSRFNYAYYIHEVKGRIQRPSTPGTIAKFLDEPAKKNTAKWLKHIESDIEEEIKRRGCDSCTV